jgi:hypothetical protein
VQEQTRRGNHERRHFQSVSLVLYLLVFTFPGLVRFKKVSARSTALRSALPLLFFSPELTSRDVNVLQRSAEETLIVRRVLVGDATLFMQARARGFQICVGSFRETSRL